VLKRYRGWILIAGLLVIAIAGTLIGLRLTSGPKLDGAGLASYMPERDAAILYINVAALRSSGILEKLVGSTVGEEAEYKTFVQQTGFDYKRDLDRMMANSAEGTHYFLLDGRFDWDKLKGYATSQGGSCSGDFCSVKGTTPGRIISFYPVSKNLMALASSLNEKAAREISPRTPVKPPFDPPAKPLWLHIPASTLQRQTDLPAGTRLFTRALETAERILFSLGPQGDRFELLMDVKCRTVEDAVVMKNQFEQLTKILQTFISREKQRPSSKDLSGVLTSGSFQRQSEHVIGIWPIEKAFVDSLSGKQIR
jgi:hypothetical protein